MEQKVQFIADYLREIYSIAELCERYRITRKTGYKWISRFIQEGPPGLKSRRSSPKSIPHRTDLTVVDALLALRKKHPSWGAKKLLVKLGQRRPTWILAARSTVFELLRPYGVISRQRRRRPVGHPGRSQRQAHEPNDIWCVDFKGEFKLGNGQYCYPLTVTDQYSRYLLVCQALPSTGADGVKLVFLRLFREFGLPRFIRSDNGTSFAANSLACLSSLSAWWIQMGVLPDLIEPGKPQQNGQHERMHRTRKAESTRPAANTFQGQQRKFNRFIEEFNQERPHEALGMHTPASCYTASSRLMPRMIAPFEYPDHFEVRYVSANGGIRWNHRWVNVSQTCKGQYVGLEVIEENVWNVFYGPIKLGRFHEAKMRIEDEYGRLERQRQKT